MCVCVYIMHVLKRVDGSFLAVFVEWQEYYHENNFQRYQALSSEVPNDDESSDEEEVMFTNEVPPSREICINHGLSYCFLAV